MLNALLTQAARDGPATSTSSRTSATAACAFAWTARCVKWCSPTALHAALISRLKIMADLDISEKRLPQDGRISLRLGTAPSTCAYPPCPAPMANAPCCASWTKSENKISLEAVGMQGETLRRFEG